MIFLKYISDSFAEQKERIKVIVTDPKSDFFISEDLNDINEKDLEDIPDNFKEGLELIFVDNVDDVLKIALTKPLIPIEWDESESVSGGSEISDDDQEQDQDPLLTH